MPVKNTCNILLTCSFLPRKRAKKKPSSWIGESRRAFAFCQFYRLSTKMPVEGKHLYWYSLPPANRTHVWWQDHFVARGTLEFIYFWTEHCAGHKGARLIDVATNYDADDDGNMIISFWLVVASVIEDQSSATGKPAHHFANFISSLYSHQSFS